MKTASQILSELRIEARHFHEGSQSTKWPACSHTRKKKTAKCLKVTIDKQGVQWYCHHCEDNGGIYYDGKVERKSPPRRQATVDQMRRLRNV